MKRLVPLLLLALTSACPKSVTVDPEARADLGPPPAPDPIPTGATATATIGPEGGQLELEQLVLTVPAGALDAPVELRVTATGQAVPPGFTAYSPVFRFEPAGLRFALPVEVRLPYEGDGAVATIFWTDERGHFAARPTTVAPPIATTAVEHFSQAFVGTACADCCRRAAGALDLLLTIDDSGSMTEEQFSLAAQVPRLVQALATGDIDGDGTQEFPAVASLRVGVISTDLGGVACGSERGDDGILRTAGNTADPSCQATYPSWLDLDARAPRDLATDTNCVAMALGTGGCGYEQPLDATLKALAPSTSGITFPSGTPTGQGDGANAGFLREDAVLALLSLTDEDDCSTTDPSLFDPENPEWDPNLNLRCYRHPDALQPLARYVEGVLALKADPTQVVYASITGVPTDLAGADFETILADERMSERVDPADPTRLVPSCDVPGRGRAYPPRRMVRAAQALEAAGAKAVVGSICTDRFDGAIAAILERVAAGISGSCD